MSGEVINETSKGLPPACNKLAAAGLLVQQSDNIGKINQCNDCPVQQINVPAHYSPAGRLLIRMTSHHSNDSSANEEASISMNSVLTDGLDIAKLSNMTHLMHHPISAGFLFRFCEAQYCSENIRFIMEVDRYRDLFHAEKRGSSKLKWGDAKRSFHAREGQTGFTSFDWKVIDAHAIEELMSLRDAEGDTRSLLEAAVRHYKSGGSRYFADNTKRTAGIDDDAQNGCTATAFTAVSIGAVSLQGLATTENTMTTSEQDDAALGDESHLSSADGILIPKSTWPSAIVDRQVVEERIAYIWDQFLADSAEYQICMPATVLANTLKRIKLAHKYGKEIFQEALQDPINTIQRDIRPRFINSPEMKELKSRVEDLYETPCASSLRLPRPKSTVASKYKKDEITKPDFIFPLCDVLEDVTLYDNFMKYLVRIVCSENLRFLRAVRVFQERIVSADPTIRAEGVEWAWNIFRFFLNPNSAYEVSVEHSVRRNVMRQLATPSFHMFTEVEKTTMQLLKLHYETFCQQTSTYAMLKSKAVEAIVQGSATQNGNISSAAAAKKSGCFG